MRKKITMIVILCICLVLSLLTACKQKEEEPEQKTQFMVAENIPISHEPEFGGVYIHLTIDEFNDLSFSYGDSVYIIFSNGYVMEDIPYYNGYYVKTGEPLLIAYPGYDYIKAAINNGDDLWEVAGLEDNMTVSIYMHQQGGYMETQHARNLQYTDLPEDYPSDVAFANFRNLTGGQLRTTAVYRSASPSDNQHNRAVPVDLLAEKVKIQYVLDLADTEETLHANVENPTFESFYFKQLYDDGNYSAIGLNTRYDNAEFKEKLISGLMDMMSHDGPYLIHCTEGKDRTGFVCMLLEALCGASYEEIVNDYMITYENYYHFTLPQDKDRYDIIVSQVLDPMIQTMTGSDMVDIYTTDLSVYAREYLLSGGMDASNIDTLYETLTGIDTPDVK